jgi:hypothetical protein
MYPFLFNAFLLWKPYFNDNFSISNHNYNIQSFMEKIYSHKLSLLYSFSPFLLCTISTVWFLMLQLQYGVTFTRLSGTDLCLEYAFIKRCPCSHTHSICQDNTVMIIKHTIFKAWGQIISNVQRNSSYSYKMSRNLLIIQNKNDYYFNIYEIII